MLINSIKISNILSFPYLENIDSNPGISFYNHGKWNVNILIWPNWSGKTNFLEIITQTIQIWLMNDYIYNWNIQDQHDTITQSPQSLRSIKAHFSHPDKPSNIKLELQISDNDKENIYFLQKKKDIFNKIIEDYSNLKSFIPDWKVGEIKTNQTITLEFYINTTNQTIELIDRPRTILESMIINYLTNQELFQICIMIYNITKPDTERSLYPLKNNFWYISSIRNFDDLANKETKIELREQYVAQKNSFNNSSTIWYALCIRKILNIINHSSEENAHQTDKTIEYTQENIDQKLKNSLFFKSLQDNITKYLDFKLQVRYCQNWWCVNAWKIELLFVDKIWQIQKLWDLSHGEQSLLIIILTIHWHDLRDWLLIIDEPEIHFHPQIQRRLIKMLEKLSENIGTQCIISTYSPIFINEKNISNVFRFSKIKWNTIVKSPEWNIGEDESWLVQILKFENASKMFFVDKIIMVEWEIDAYFFEFYLQYLHNSSAEWKEKLTNYEIININGKWSYNKWNKFLNKFGIQSYFIWDWDNIVDYGFMTQSDLNFYYKKAKSFYNANRKTKDSGDRHYTKLVNVIRKLYPEKYQYIIQNIEKLYKNKVFVLKNWDIETYLWMNAKWLEETINFCHKYFHLWLRNEDLLEHRKEFEFILQKIFG